MRWLIWCALLISGFCVLPFICFPHDFVFGTFGSLAGIAPCSFALPRLGFVINLFFILLSGRSAVGNMSVGGLKPHVLGELDLVTCFILSPFDILNWTATQISSCSLSLEFCHVFSASFVQTTRARFLARCRHVHGANPFCRLAHHPCIERWSCRHQQHRHCGCLADSPNMSWGEKQTTAVNLRHPNYCCQCNPYEGPVDCPDADNSGKPCC